MGRLAGLGVAGGMQAHGAVSLQAVEFLSKAVDSPNIKAVDEAVILLQEIGEWWGWARLEWLPWTCLTVGLLQGCWTSGST